MNTSLSFVKHFTGGTLVGLNYSETLRFISHDSAARWLDGLKDNIARGELPYTIASLKASVPLVADDVAGWYDACTLDERECYLKAELLGTELEGWFSDLCEESADHVCRVMAGQAVEMSEETFCSFVGEVAA